MTTPGTIATHMYLAMRDIEATLQQLASALNLPAYEAPDDKYRDRAYADMVRMRSLADWLQSAVDKLDELGPRLLQNVREQQAAAIQQLLTPLTKEQLVKLAEGFDLDVPSDAKKGDIIEALVQHALEPAVDDPADEAAEAS